MSWTKEAADNRQFRKPGKGKLGKSPDREAFIGLAEKRGEALTENADGKARCHLICPEFERDEGEEQGKDSAAEPSDELSQGDVRRRPDRRR